MAKQIKCKYFLNIFEYNFKISLNYLVIVDHAIHEIIIAIIVISSKTLRYDYRYDC